ncbi:hypothetical protein VFPBJ_11326 [Purpureocillium lilacinum]|uniref:Uncharacterized protein n=1 Tax=Purpureocillium lilacinum TaxID=33203 RepID=A0A179FEE7_PURLI|nr:hypothetical protein VFPBJ_11326 [Purpureocillium lilacinum]
MRGRRWLPWRDCLPPGEGVQPPPAWGWLNVVGLRADPCKLAHFVIPANLSPSGRDMAKGSSSNTKPQSASSLTAKLNTASPVTAKFDAVSSMTAKFKTANYARPDARSNKAQRGV